MRRRIELAINSETGDAGHVSRLKESKPDA